MIVRVTYIAVSPANKRIFACPSPTHTHIRQTISPELHLRYLGLMEIFGRPAAGSKDRGVLIYGMSLILLVDQMHLMRNRTHSGLLA